MQNRIILFIAGCIVLLTIPAIMFVGCDDEPGLADLEEYFDDAPFEGETRVDGELPLTISPKVVGVGHIDQIITFRTLAAQPPVTWTLADYERGTLVHMSGNTEYVAYRSLAVSENSITATDAKGRSSTVAIQQGSRTFSIIPSEVTLLRPDAGPQIYFNVVGGTPPYGNWEESHPQLGVITAGDVYNVVTPGLIGDNTLSLQDSAGLTAIATVEHVVSLDDLSIVPQTTVLDEDGDTALYIAVGGYGPYTFRVTYPTYGTIISQPDDRSILYRRDNPGNQIIIVEDSQGSFAQVTVTQQAPTPPVITPSVVTLSSNVTSYAFTVTDGTPPYVWVVLTPGGSVSPNLGTSVVFTDVSATRPGSQILQVTDGNSQTALATIILE